MGKKKERIIQTFYGLGNSAAGRLVSKPFQSHSHIVMYHRVLPDKDAELDRTGMAIGTSTFEAHLKMLKANFRVLSIDSWLEEHRSGSVNQAKPSVVITFDDGYRDNLDVALPLLRKYNAPATFYITTRFADGDNRMWWYDLDTILLGHAESGRALTFEWKNRAHRLAVASATERKSAYDVLRELFVGEVPARQDELLKLISLGVELTPAPETLSWNDLRSLASDPLATIGAHTVSHPVLSQLPPDDAARECDESRKRLEDELKIPVRHFAYPFGTTAEAGAREYELIEKLGFLTGVTTNSAKLRTGHSPFDLPRAAVKRRTSADHLRAKLSGWLHLPLWSGIQI